MWKENIAMRKHGNEEREKGRIMNDYVCEHLGRQAQKWYKDKNNIAMEKNNELTPVMSNVDFQNFIRFADTEIDISNDSLGKLYMTVLDKYFPEIYKEVKDTELDTSIYREHMPILFRYLTRKP